MSILQELERLKKRRTKIVATLGPATQDSATLARLVEAGADLFRLNMSHGDHEFHARVYRLARRAAEDVGRPIAILADLCGPKIRVGTFVDGCLALSEGERVTITTRRIQGDAGLIPSQYEALTDDVVPGTRILLDDGLIELRVEAMESTEVDCSVVRGGMLKDKKGINLPEVSVSVSALTEKDRRDALFAASLGVEFLALSFVCSERDILDLRAHLKGLETPPDVIAKIERAEALESIDGILAASDAVMVARGDLGVELPLEQVPLIQEDLVYRARRRNRPAIVATQMLDSMVHNARPTRAEVSDVAHAVASGVDAVMLSAETATGDHPVEAVYMMDRIIRETEAFQWKQSAFGSLTGAQPVELLPVEDAVARYAAQLARDLKVRAIVVLSRSGVSAGVMSAARPAAPVVAVSGEDGACRRMNLNWGLVPMIVEGEELEDPETLVRRLVKQLGLAEPGQFVLLVRGFKHDLRFTAPSVTVLCA